MAAQRLQPRRPARDWGRQVDSAPVLQGSSAALRSLQQPPACRRKPTAAQTPATPRRIAPQTKPPMLPSPRHQAHMPRHLSSRQPLFPDSRGPRTVLDLMPKGWDRPFSGWACAYDASLGISHASQAYIRKMQWLRHRRPSMRRGAPQAQLRFSSWEVSPSSHGSQACSEGCARQCAYADCGAVGRNCRGCASMGGLRSEHTYPAMRSWPRGPTQGAK